MKNLTDKKLNKLAEDNNDNVLYNAVIDELKASTDPNDRARWLKDLLCNGGCQSGMVSSLIYYGDTNAFYDKYKEEIWELATEQSQEQGHDNVLQFIASFNGANIGDDTQFKNLLAWYGFEETARKLADDLNLEF